nr:hypothetical protein [Actinoplanes lutulentus]
MRQISPRAGDCLVLRAESRRAMEGELGERLAGLVAVAQLLGDLAQVVADPQDQQTRVTVTALAGGVGLLKHPASRARIIDAAADRGQVKLRGEHLRMIVTKPDPPQLTGTLQQQARRTQIAGGDEETGPLHSVRQRGHDLHAARFVARRPPLIWAGAGTV